ncbi:MAG: PrsW family intramembrane metalloprotease [Anaerolineae bacterium]|nr:PrsW family intramembrane metalloprotease [Anaerolineae bacterium]
MLDVLLILLLSFIPMLVYAGLLWWLDRYEKEPFGLLVTAFLWGAVPSIILALIMQVVLDIPIIAISTNQLIYNLLGASVIAPITEEGVKSLSLLVLLLLFRREIDSPIDGLIYGGMVGFGFAAVENVFYLFGAYSEGGIAEVWSLAFLRAGIFGLNHAMYTAFAGLGVALSLEIKQKVLKPLPVIAGISLAMLTHATHNTLATLTEHTSALTLILAILADWGGVFILLGIALATMLLERHRIAIYSQKLASDRMIPLRQVDVLKSVFLRRNMILQALFRGDFQRWWTLKRYHQKVSEAAFTYHRAQLGDGNAPRNLARLETEYTALRQNLM